jgi:hypothetical protein
MKKSLIALAALAAFGTASAQSTVTISGKFGYAYTDQNIAGVKTAGFQVTDGDVGFAAVEDLGGGLKATASMVLKVRGRGTQASVVDGRDASIGLSGDFGSITAGAIEAANGIMGLGGAGAPTIGQDGRTLDAAGNVDIFSYQLPTLVTGLTLKASVIDGVGDVARTKGNVTLLSVGYTNGPLTLAADNSQYAKYSDSAAVDGACVPAAGTSVTALTSKTATCTGGTIVRAYASAVSALDSRTRISAQYDLGVVKFGLGYQVKSYVTSTVKDNKQTIIGVSAPLGAFTVGATSTSNKTDDAATKTTGNEFGVNYALSKRTSVAVARTSWKVTGAAADSYTRVRLMHSF